MGDKIFNIAGAIVTVALVTTIVSNKESANVIKAIGSSFSATILSAMGKNPGVKL